MAGFDESADLWFLVEWQIPGGPSTYGVISWDSLVDPPARHKFNTGKIVLAKRGKRDLPANIVIISDDKEFLYAELKQIRSMAAANLLMRLENCSQGTTVKQDVNRKRRKTNPVTADSPSDISRPLPSIPLRVTQSPVPFVMNSGANTNGPMNLVLSSNHGNGMHVNSTQSVQSSAPPMTFDQQTQTDLKMADNENKIEAQQELLEDVHQTQIVLKDDVMTLQGNMNELLKQMGMVQNMLTQMQGNKTIYTPHRETRLIERVTRSSSPPVESSTPVTHIKVDRNSIAADFTSSPSLEEEFEESMHSNASLHCKPLSTHNKINMSFGGFPNRGFIQESRPWERMQGDIFHIGPGQTPVARHVMTQINWTSHTIATRKLLMAVFPRETLATHSLTGKASPAFHGLVTKPQKMRLDKRKIEDIIQTVTEYCGVRETAVRSAITTKCADENKMLRARAEKVKQNSKEDKENEDDVNDDQLRLTVDLSDN